MAEASEPEGARACASLGGSEGSAGAGRRSERELRVSVRPGAVLHMCFRIGLTLSDSWNAGRMQTPALCPELQIDVCCALPCRWRPRIFLKLSCPLPPSASFRLHLRATGDNTACLRPPAQRRTHPALPACAHILRWWVATCTGDFTAG